MSVKYLEAYGDVTQSRKRKFRTIDLDQGAGLTVEETLSTDYRNFGAGPSRAVTQMAK